MLKRVALTLVTLVIVNVTTLWAQPPAPGQPPPGAFQPTGPVSPASLVGQVERGCFACHDNRPAGSNIPNREALWKMTPEKLYEAITTGPKAAHVNDQKEIATDVQKRAAAELITGKTFGGSADRAASAMKNRCANPLKLDMSKPAWNGFSPDLGATKFQTAEAAKLTPAQVPNLKLKWAFALPGAYSTGSTQPSVVGGAVFTASDNNYVYALDAKTGCVYWSYDNQNLVRASVVIGPIKDRPGVRFAAYFGDYMGRIVALNAETGEHLWTVKDPHSQAKMTSAGVVDPNGERIYWPVASWEEQTGAMVNYECCSFQGSMMGIDVKAGKKVWQTYAFQERPHPLGKKNNAGKDLFGPAGAGIWNTPALDLKRRALYAGVGNCNTTEHFGTQDWEGVTGHACDSVIAVDMDTGKRLWQTQILPGDSDEGGCGRGPERRINCPGFVQGPGDDVNQVMLVTAANGRRYVIASQESGRITALDPDKNGAVLWVSQAGDTVTAGSAFGGASDGKAFYRPLPFRDGTGAVAAMKLENGERLWYVTLTKEKNCADPNSPACGPANRAGAWVIPGVLFTGSRDGMLRAYSTDDGKILWEFNCNRSFDTVNGVPGVGGPFGGPGGSVADGMVYIGVGYGVLGGGTGNMLLAFGVD